MSLKAFHIIFVTISILFALFFSVWAIGDYRANRNPGSLVWAGVSLLAAVVLAVYGRWFLRKLKGVSYL